MVTDICPYKFNSKFGKTAFKPIVCHYCTAIHLCALVVESGLSLQKLTDMKEYPQININIMTDKKDDIAKDSELLALVSRLSANLYKQKAIAHLSKVG